MATQYGIYSVTLADAKGERSTVAAYLQYDDSTATLASIAAAMASIVAKIDAITEAVVIKHSFALQTSLPGGLKAAAVADSDVEETGLFTFVSDSPNGAAFSIDVPAILQTLLAGKDIIITSGAGQTFVNEVTAPSGTFLWMDNTFQSLLPQVRSAQKTFRKHRRAAKRA